MPSAAATPSADSEPNRAQEQTAQHDDDQRAAPRVVDLLDDHRGASQCRHALTEHAQQKPGDITELDQPGANR
jgi:hypothetical protein